MLHCVMVAILLSDQIAFSNSESNVAWRASKLPPWPPSWKLELNNFSNSESPCHPMPPSSFGSIWLKVWEEMWFKEFQHGCLWYHNKMILAILNLHNTSMPPIKFKLNLTYHSCADVIWRFSRWLQRWPSWISRGNHFSNSKSPCCPNAFHQVLAQYN